MTAPARLPTNAPFPPDAIAALNRVIEQTSPTQRSWLSGFLAGVEAATSPVAAPVSVARPALTILFATESGNSEALARRASKDAARLGFAPKVVDAAGLAGDMALRGELLAHHDVTTLSGYLVRSLAELTGDPAIKALADDAERLAEFLPGRQVVDLLTAFPNRLTAPQLTGLLRALPPRLYSVASSQAMVGDEAHILVGAVRYQSHGRDRTGVASTYVADRRRAGDRLGVYVKPNTHFRLPADAATPVIMIGPGTGVAPFRAFMQDRDAAGISGRSWLFFGDRQYTHDFLYQLEWQDMLERGVLGRLDVAFSRDQDAKSYVQHRMWDQRKDMFAWLEDGARVYVCGDQVHMARDVHATLRDIIADGAAIESDAAEDRLATLKQQGRYLLDVY